MLRIAFCGSCCGWSAWLTCKACGRDSRQLPIEAEWATCVSLDIDPSDEIEGESVACCSCGETGAVDAPRRSRRGARAPKVFIFDVDYDSGPR